jgi:branched-chain amino acid transport system permease protein
MGTPAPRPPSAERSPLWPWAVAGVLFLVAIDRGFVGQLSDYGQRIVVLAGINIILAVSLNVINGVTGQFSIGHAGFMAIGAYVAAALTVFGGTALEHWAAHGPIDAQHPVLNLFLVKGQAAGVATVALSQAWFALTLLAAGLAAALCGVLVGLPTLRLRGDYLAIATLGFGEIVRVVLLNLEVVGGASGFSGRPPFEQIPSYTNFLNVYLVALLLVMAVTALKRSAGGRALVAIREDEVAAEAVGIDTTRYKVRAFAFSAFFAGVAGGLLAHYLGLIIPSPTMFGFLRSIEIIAMVVLGGSGSTTGCLIAAVVLTVLPERLRDLEQWRMVLYAEVLVVMMLFRRQGLMGTRELEAEDWRKLGRFLRRERLGGVLRGLARRLDGWRRALGERLFITGAPKALGWLALALLAVPVIDFLLFAPALGEMLVRAQSAKPPAWLAYAGSPPRTLAADVCAALSALVPRGFQSVGLLKPLAGELQLPLAANPGLSLALLPLLGPWSALCYRLAKGDRRPGGWLLAGLALALWHGAGLLAQHQGGARQVVEAVVAALLAAWLVVALLTVPRRRRGGE